LRTGMRSMVARNAASLYLIQFANYIVPLIMVPYLVRVLGPAGYGAVAFAQGFINYLMLFVEYGFDWSATRKISVIREDRAAVNRIALHVWAAKGLLSLVGLVVLGALTVAVSKLREVAVLLFALYGLVVGNALFPTWLFQGMERMVAISLINLAMKLGILAGVFLLVKRPEDAVLYAGLLGGGSLLAGLAGALVAFRMFGLQLMGISARGIGEALREGWVLFLARSTLSISTVGNAFILGMVTSPTVVGYYSAAEKLVLAVYGMTGPIVRATYPKVCRLLVENKLYQAKKYFRLVVLLGLVLTLTVFITAAEVVSILFGNQYIESILVLKVLSFCVLLYSISNALAFYYFFPSRNDSIYQKIIVISALINIVFAIPLSLKLQEVGMATAVVLSALFMTVALYFSSRKTENYQLTVSN